jgi:hypothetical protein
MGYSKISSPTFSVGAQYAPFGSQGRILGECHIVNLYNPSCHISAELRSVGASSAPIYRGRVAKRIETEPTYAGWISGFRYVASLRLNHRRFATQSALASAAFQISLGDKLSVIIGVNLRFLWCKIALVVSHAATFAENHGGPSTSAS